MAHRPPMRPFMRQHNMRRSPPNQFMNRRRGGGGGGNMRRKIHQKNEIVVKLGL